MDLTEAEGIKKRWQEYTEELYKKDLNPDDHDGVITHLEPDILEWEVKWALGSISTNKASGMMELQLSYFKSWKMLCQSGVLNMSANWKTQQWPWDWKRSVFIPIPKKGNAKECSKYCTIALLSHTSKVMLKILQARLQQSWTMNVQMFKLVLEKAEEPEIKLPTSAGSSKKLESSRKNLFLLY